MVPSSIKSLIVLHSGDMPKMNSAIHVHKAECNDTLVEHDNDQYLSILRLTIFAENMPVSERIIAGDKYIKKGGNGDTKKYYQQMLKEHTK